MNIMVLVSYSKHSCKSTIPKIDFVLFSYAFFSKNSLQIIKKKQRIVLFQMLIHYTRQLISMGIISLYIMLKIAHAKEFS